MSLDHPCVYEPSHNCSLDRCSTLCTWRYLDGEKNPRKQVLPDDYDDDRPISMCEHPDNELKKKVPREERFKDMTPEQEEQARIKELEEHEKTMSTGVEPDAVTIVERKPHAFHYAYFGNYKGSDQGKCPICGKVVWCFKDALSLFFDNVEHPGVRDVEWYHGTCYEKAHGLDWSAVDCTVDDECASKKLKPILKAKLEAEAEKAGIKNKNCINRNSHIGMCRHQPTCYCSHTKVDDCPTDCKYLPKEKPAKGKKEEDCEHCKDHSNTYQLIAGGTIDLCSKSGGPCKSGALHIKDIDLQGKINELVKTCGTCKWVKLLDSKVEAKCTNPKSNSCDDPVNNPNSHHFVGLNNPTGACEHYQYKKPYTGHKSVTEILTEQIVEQVKAGVDNYRDLAKVLKVDKFSLKPAVKQLVKIGRLAWADGKFGRLEIPGEKCKDLGGPMCPCEDVRGCDDAAPMMLEAELVEEKWKADHIGPCKTCHFTQSYPADKDGHVRLKCVNPKATAKGRIIRQVDHARTEGCYEPQIGVEPEKPKPTKKAKSSDWHDIPGKPIGKCCDGGEMKLTESGEVWCDLCGIIYRPDPSKGPKHVDGKGILCTPEVSLSCRRYHIFNKKPVINEFPCEMHSCTDHQNLWGYYCHRYVPKALKERQVICDECKSYTTLGGLCKQRNKHVDPDKPRYCVSYHPKKEEHSSAAGAVAPASKVDRPVLRKKKPLDGEIKIDTPEKKEALKALGKFCGDAIHEVEARKPQQATLDMWVKA